MQFRQLLQLFSKFDVVCKRFPVPAKVHEGWKARLYNDVFVGPFNRLLRRRVARSGHQFLALAAKLRWLLPGSNNIDVNKGVEALGLRSYHFAINWLKSCAGRTTR